MTIAIILISILAISGLVYFLRRKPAKKDWGFVPYTPSTPSTPVETPEVPSEGEMPIRPEPVDCQKATFRPAPEDFFYVDCCGKPQKGEGFQPWEKRPPVSIDVNKPFMGMDLIGEPGDSDC